MLDEIMGVTIGKLHIGHRNNDAHLWKKYLIPKAYNSDRYFKHHYYKFYYRWLNFFWCMPRKCECCGKYMTEAGGTNIYDRNGNNLLITICKPCKDSKECVDEYGIKHKGYTAWLHELWK